MEWLQDWPYILITVIALAFVLFIGQGYWRLKKEITEFVNAVTEALEDGKVDDMEIAKILKELNDVGATLKSITLAVLRLIPKR